MDVRPKPSDNEEDLLRMQDEYLAEKGRNENLKPAAAVTNLRSAQKRSHLANCNIKKPSKFALKRGLVPQDRESGDTGPSDKVLEKNAGLEDNIYFPKVLPLVLGDILEKNPSEDVESSPSFPCTGFPEVSSTKVWNPVHVKVLPQIVADASTSQHIINNSIKDSLINTSDIVTSEDAKVIHMENVQKLSQMTELEIMQEQQKLLNSLDPKIIRFIKSKKSNISDNSKMDIDEAPSTTDCKRVIFKSVTVNDSPAPSAEEDLWDNDVLLHPDATKWLNFNSFEKDKLEWMKGLKESEKHKPNEPYEARFDFQGYLLPYSIEYSEETKTLFHHGDEPHRPGYSIVELIELTRAAVVQQRVMALNTIAGILEYASTGIYKDVIDIPISKIFFVVRFALDENKVIVLEPALKAMRNLIYNRVDEASLDALLGLEEGTIQPCLENDKSEITELETKESELKDFHLSEIDLIAAAIRTDIIQRIYYILDCVRPTFNSVQYCLQILTRLVRDSVDTAQKIVKSKHLIETIIKNFIPASSINFMFDPHIIYRGKPVLAALKLLRILTLQTPEITSILVNDFDILMPISLYLSSGVDGTYGLRFQIESFCILSNCLSFSVGLGYGTSLCPVLLTSLYKHVQGTDVLVDGSVLSTTHCSVLLQCINKLMQSGSDLANYKAQIIDLLMGGLKKWLGQASNLETFTCGHLRVICAVFDCCRTVIKSLMVDDILIKDALRKIINSKGYSNLTKQVIPCSNLLSGIENRHLYSINNLVTLNGTIVHSKLKILPILKMTSPIQFLGSLFKLLECVRERQIVAELVLPLLDYIKAISEKPLYLCDNWFTRLETDFIFSFLKVVVNNNIAENHHQDMVYAIANKLSYILRADKKEELKFLFDNIIFNKHWFTPERLLSISSISESDSFPMVISEIYNVKLCYSNVINHNYIDSGPNVVIYKWKEPILPRDWIYLPILKLYCESQDIVNGSESPCLEDNRDKEMIVACSLEWILFNELCFPEFINDIDITDRFCRILCVFLCDNSLFLDSKIKVVLRKCVKTLFYKAKSSPFDFDKELVGLSSFQKFYTQLLDQFQSVSYGDETFASCVLVPIALHHNFKWRKLLWSEYAGCLRSLDCRQDLLCYNVDSYLYPQERDESLLKSYSRALMNNLVRPNTIVHLIASHHTAIVKS